MSELLTVTGLGAQPRLYLVGELLLGGARHPVGQQIGVVGGQQRGGGLPVLVHWVGPVPLAADGQPHQGGQSTDDQDDGERGHGRSPPRASTGSGRYTRTLTRPTMWPTMRNGSAMIRTTSAHAAITTTAAATARRRITGHPRCSHGPRVVAGSRPARTRGTATRRPGSR